MIMRGITDVEHIVSSATYTLAVLCLVSKLQMGSVFKVNTYSEHFLLYSVSMYVSKIDYSGLW